MVSISRCLYTDISVASLSLHHGKWRKEKSCKGRSSLKCCVYRCPESRLYIHTMYSTYATPYEKEPSDLVFGSYETPPWCSLLTHPHGFLCGQAKFHLIVRILFSLYPLQMPGRGFVALTKDHPCG